MIGKDKIDSIPSSARDAIVAYLERKISVEKKARDDGAFMYMNTLEERHRAASLRAGGKVDAFEAVLSIFNEV